MQWRKTWLKQFLTWASHLSKIRLLCGELKPTHLRVLMECQRKEAPRRRYQDPSCVLLWVRQPLVTVYSMGRKSPTSNTKENLWHHLMRGKVPLSPRKQNLPENWVSWQSTSIAIGWFSLMSLIVLSNNCFSCTFNVVGIEYTAMNKRGMVLVKGQAGVGWGRKVFPNGAPKSESSHGDISCFPYMETELRMTDHLQFVRNHKTHPYATSSNVHIPPPRS